MRAIRRLPAHDSLALQAAAAIPSLCAAGEALVANALDAGARAVCVGLHAPSGSVQVDDDGCGIPGDALAPGGPLGEAACSSASGGARKGCALLALAQLGRLELCSRPTRGAAASSKVVAFGAALPPGAPVAAPPPSGTTTVAVRGLFGRLPVRAAALHPARELAALVDAVVCLSLAHPAVGFRVHDAAAGAPADALVLAALPAAAATALARFRQLFGPERAAATVLLDWRHVVPGADVLAALQAPAAAAGLLQSVHISGCVGLGHHSRELQFVHVNGAPLRRASALSDALHAALQRAGRARGARALLPALLLPPPLAGPAGAAFQRARGGGGGGGGSRGGGRRHGATEQQLRAESGHPVFVIDVSVTPATAVAVTHEAGRSLVQFSNAAAVTEALTAAVARALGLDDAGAEAERAEEGEGRVEGGRPGLEASAAAAAAPRVSASSSCEPLLASTAEHEVEEEEAGAEVSSQFFARGGGSGAHSSAGSARDLAPPQLSHCARSWSASALRSESGAAAADGAVPRLVAGTDRSVGWGAGSARPHIVATGGDSVSTAAHPSLPGAASFEEAWRHALPEGSECGECAAAAAASAHRGDDRSELVGVRADGGGASCSCAVEAAGASSAGRLAVMPSTSGFLARAADGQQQPLPSVHGGRVSSHELQLQPPRPAASHTVVSDSRPAAGDAAAQPPPPPPPPPTLAPGSMDSESESAARILGAYTRRALPGGSARGRGDSGGGGGGAASAVAAVLRPAPRVAGGASAPPRSRSATHGGVIHAQYAAFAGKALAYADIQLARAGAAAAPVGRVWGAQQGPARGQQRQAFMAHAHALVAVAAASAAAAAGAAAGAQPSAVARQLAGSAGPSPPPPASLPSHVTPLGGLRLTRAVLPRLRVLGQLDLKFILAAVDSHDGGGGAESRGPRQQQLVIIDQHAADERIRVEVIEALVFPPLRPLHPVHDAPQQQQQPLCESAELSADGLVLRPRRVGGGSSVDGGGSGSSGGGGGAQGASGPCCYMRSVALEPPWLLPVSPREAQTARICASLLRVWGFQLEVLPPPGGGVGGPPPSWRRLDVDLGVGTEGAALPRGTAAGAAAACAHAGAQSAPSAARQPTVRLRATLLRAAPPPPRRALSQAPGPAFSRSSSFSSSSSGDASTQQPPPPPPPPLLQPQQQQQQQQPLLRVCALPRLFDATLGADELREFIAALADAPHLASSASLAAATAAAAGDAALRGHTLRRLYYAGCRPPAVVRLIASKACRGATMFGDALDGAQCAALLWRLRGCRLPFQCAHGRPSMVPLATLLHGVP